MQYLGQAIILTDGHVQMHHCNTMTAKDPKRIAFTMMMELPLLIRWPVFTIQKFAQFLTGYYIRWVHVLREVRRSGGPKYSPSFLVSVFSVRALLLVEFVYCMVTGHVLFWAIQFCAALWYNQFLVLSSHDFENPDAQEPVSVDDRPDWALHQIETSIDMSVTGNRYLDCFLTAGLGTHRTHHVLPDQKSGFANIVCDDIVAETAKEFDVVWKLGEFNRSSLQLECRRFQRLPS